MKRIPAASYLADVASRATHLRHPEGATFELTYACNLRCVHCYNPTHRALPGELSTGEVRSILDQMADLGVLRIAFSGGEPLVRPDIGDILEHARRRGFLIQVLTNATRMTLPFAELMERHGVVEVIVSVYGASPRTYDQMTGVAGSFAQFLRGLESLKGRAFPVTARMPLTTVNAQDVDACESLIRSHGFTFQYCLDIHPRTDGTLAPLQYRLPPQGKATLDRRKLGRELAAWVFESCSPAEPFIACACGRTRFAITPYGEMNLCVAFPIPKYNLRAGTVRDGWEMLKRTVDEAVPGARYQCQTCSLNPFCRQGRSDAWLETGDMSQCLPHFKEWAQEIKAAHDLLDPRRPV
jgi:radical SAM protein with 4Fe4S-binding SPASM domain